MNGNLLQNRVAIVTGGGSGIGQAICSAFAQQGATVAVLDVAGDAAQAVAASVDGLAIALDVSDAGACADAVDGVADKLGAPTVLVCSAAYFAGRVPLADLGEDVWEKSLNVNIGGHFNMSKQCIPHMIEAGGGSIVHISSIMAKVANFGQTAYCTTKGALTMLSRGIALDYAKYGIRSNTLMPGGIATKGMADLYGGDMDRAEAEWGAVMHPLGRLGRVEEIADAAVFLASDRSSFITGADLPVEGGYSIR
ncbi:MAG: SDR family oxidoreductase [Silicimonas sp.]|nr:SDR family oxidoreductase [Silicimonas sp.]